MYVFLMNIANSHTRCKRQMIRTAGIKREISIFSFAVCALHKCNDKLCTHISIYFAFRAMLLTLNTLNDSKKLNLRIANDVVASLTISVVFD